MKKDLLDEYCQIHDYINKLNDKIEFIKYETKIKIYFTNSKVEKDKILNNFKKQIDSIKNNQILRNKYRKLKKRQEDIKKILLNNDNTNINNIPNTISNTIDEMINKYRNIHIPSK